jgi:hypothetical protein
MKVVSAKKAGKAIQGHWTETQVTLRMTSPVTQPVDVVL